MECRVVLASGEAVFEMTEPLFEAGAGVVPHQPNNIRASSSGTNFNRHRLRASQIQISIDIVFGRDIEEIYIRNVFLFSFG